MADVDRGQLILVTALAIAVALVAMVLLLNTVIYAENLATRGADVGGQDAVEYRGAVAEGVGGAIDAENALDYESHAAVRGNVSASVGRLDAMLARQHFTRAELAEISNLTTTDGAILRHPEDTDSFENKTDVSTWTLAADVPATRQFAMTVDRSDVNTDVPTGAFQVVVENDSSTKWIAYVFDKDGITVAVKNGSEGAPTTICEGTDSNVTIDFTSSTVGGEPCPGLVFGKGVSGTYDIRFVNGDEAGGTYNLTVKRDPDAGGSAIDDNFNDSATGTAPYYAYAVYDATVDVRFRTDGLRFTDEIRVAPGEPT